jgi:hypothetical protein
MSANQKWKESGSDLSFKEWLQQEQEAGNLEKEEFQQPKKHSSAQIFGIDSRLFIGIIIVASVAGIAYMNRSKA